MEVCDTGVSFLLSTRMTSFLFRFAFLSLATLAQAATPQEEVATQGAAARAILDAWETQQPEKGDRFVHIVYWTPADREPAPLYRERLSKIFEDVRKFYAREMERNGFGPRTIKLVRENDGLCKIHVIRGKHPYSHYDVQSGSEIRKECLPELAKAGVEADKETIVLFCNMSNWDEKARTMSQNSPYYASGSSWSGTAWQVDSPLLDLDLLDKHEPKLQDKQYGNISVGRYNSIFIGGVAHELGHALSIPHNRERPDQREAFGTALMGSGNRTYGENLRGEGKGSFLTMGEALRLASHPIFSGSVKGFQGKPNAELHDAKLVPNGKSFTFSGRIAANPPVYGIVGYTDPVGGSNYDATTYTAVPDAEGRFTFECNALTAGKAAELRIVAFQVNGAKVSNASPWNDPTFPYFVNRDGTVDLSATIARQQLAPLIAAVNGGKSDAAKSELEKFEATKPQEVILDVARSLVGTLTAEAGVSPAIAEGDRLLLSAAARKETSVGYGKPMVNRLPGDNALLMNASRLYARGLYAHAPARHVWDLGGKWGRLQGTAGVADGQGGSVVFRVLADGRELWHSRMVKEGDSVAFDVPVKDAKDLELIVTDGGDGNRADWGLWLDPVLTR